MNAQNKIDYVEFPSADPMASRAFFEAVFGWEFEDYGPDYQSFKDGRVAGGFTRAQPASGGPLIVLYHPKLEETLERVASSGGRVTQHIFSFPGGRRFHFAEPGGAELAVWSE